jgi:hypothetical protein
MNYEVIDCDLIKLLYVIDSIVSEFAPAKLTDKPINYQGLSQS